MKTRIIVLRHGETEWNKKKIFQGQMDSPLSDGEKVPEELRQCNSGDPDHNIPEGEGSRQRHDRSTICFFDSAKRHAGLLVCIVTHGGVLRGILEPALHLPQNRKRRFSLYNAGIARFSHYNGHWMMDSRGETNHLNGIQPRDEEN